MTIWTETHTFFLNTPFPSFTQNLQLNVSSNMNIRDLSRLKILVFQRAGCTDNCLSLSVLNNKPAKCLRCRKINSEHPGFKHMLTFLTLLYHKSLTSMLATIKWKMIRDSQNIYWFNIHISLVTFLLLWDEKGKIHRLSLYQYIQGIANKQSFAKRRIQSAFCGSK